MNFEIFLLGLIIEKGKSLDTQIFEGKQLKKVSYFELVNFLSTVSQEDKFLIQGTLENIRADKNKVFTYLHFLASGMVDFVGAATIAAAKKPTECKILHFPEPKDQKALQQ